MAKLYKLVVTGMFNAGKTTFVNTLSEISTVNTDRVTTRSAEAKIKATTTVALDYGNVWLNKNVNIHLFGTPGQDRFDCMRDLLADGMHGFIFLIDSSDQNTLKQASKLLHLFKKRSNVPYLLVANKADRNGFTDTQIRKQFKLANGQPIVPCVATKKDSVRAVVERLVEMIESRPI